MSKELDKVNEIHHTKAIYKVDGTTVIESSLFNLLVAYAKEALQRLESIDNANPSEALKLVEELDNCLISDMSIEVDDYDESNYCMSYEYVDFNGEGLQFNDDIKEETIIDFIREKKISTIKQALLKAQEPKKYLKWGDLKFTKKSKEMLVKLGDTTYPMRYYKVNDNTNKVCISSFQFIEIYDIRFFNDLHLEVEE